MASRTAKKVKPDSPAVARLVTDPVKGSEGQAGEPGARESPKVEAVPKDKTGLAGVPPADSGAQEPQRKDTTETSPVARTTKRYAASIFPLLRQDLPADFAKDVLKLQELIGMPLWLLVQNDSHPFAEIGDAVYGGFWRERLRIAQNEPVAILLDSPGGSAHFAYKIARLFQRRCSRLTVVVPQYAKSAATLLALGANNLILGQDAELGPLDVQIINPEREDIQSALDTVQALERLNAAALTALDQSMGLLVTRTRKKIETLLPMTLTYIGHLMRPLFEKIDSVDYSRQSRDLKVAEEYATRLMTSNYSKEAQRIARILVGDYPCHNFVIDADEGKKLGLNITEPDADTNLVLERIIPHLNTVTAVGLVEEIKK